MRKCDFWGFHTQIDEFATREWYAGSTGWACECGHCRNFLALARKRALPATVLEPLDKLGIAPEKATYVCEMYQNDDGFLYQFSYRIAGNILNEEKPVAEPQNWGEGRCCHETYPYGAPNFPSPHFDLEFWVTLPWVLEESPNG